MTEHALWQADAVALADRVGVLLSCMRSAEAELGALLVEIEQRGVMEVFGYRSVSRLLEHLADVPRSSVERMVKRARAVNPGRNLDGTSIRAVAAATGVVARSGRLSNPMIDVIVGVLQEVPVEHRDSAEQHLLSFAEEAGHRQVAALGARILAHLDPHGAELAGWWSDGAGESGADVRSPSSVVASFGVGSPDRRRRPPRIPPHRFLDRRRKPGRNNIHQPLSSAA